MKPRPKHDDWIRGLSERAASLGPNATALVAGEERVDYAGLASAAAETRRSLLALGLERGDLVGVLAPPSLEGVTLIHAMLDLGIVFLPLSARLSEVEQRDALASTGARFLFVSADSDAEAHGARLVEKLGTGLLSFGRPAGVRGDAGVGLALSIRARPKGEVECEAAARRALRIAEGAALVLHTSGTSGRPKGAVLTFDNLMASALASGELLGADSADRWLLCMPLFHIGGLSILLRSALAGACVYLQPVFDSEAALRSLERDGITHVSFVATMLERVLAARPDQRAPTSLAVVLLGGGPASDALIRRAESLGYPIAPTYGLTEAASQVATRPPGVRSAAERDPAGGLVPLPGVELRIMNVRGPVAAGIVGEIEVRGPILMAGYLDDPEATREALREGWLATGDLGRVDDEGCLRVLDRRTDLILSGGENVYPAEVESMLVECEGVREAAVFGIADETFGARPMAVVVMDDGVAFDPSVLADFCRDRMAGYKRPVDFKQVESLPRTATGKLKRRTLRAQFTSG